jgi:hypothetical protein
VLAVGIGGWEYLLQEVDATCTCTSDHTSSRRAPSAWIYQIAGIDTNYLSYIPSPLSFPWVCPGSATSLSCRNQARPKAEESAECSCSDVLCVLLDHESPPQLLFSGGKCSSSSGGIQCWNLRGVIHEACFLEVVGHNYVLYRFRTPVRYSYRAAAK